MNVYWLSAKDVYKRQLVRKLIITDENNITKGQLITVMGSGLIGALVYTFSETFWFLSLIHI